MSPMFERILVALDGSEEAQKAAALALRLGARLGSQVTGLSVIDARVVEGPPVETLAPLWGEVTGRPFQPEVMRAYRERADRIVERFCQDGEQAGCGRVERYVEIGVAEEVILAWAESADLLAMGRRGEHAGFGRHSLGATTWRVLHRVRHPVLVAGAASGTPLRPLVAYDASEGASRALDLAARYTAAVGGELRVVHAGEESADGVLDAAGQVLSDRDLEWEAVRLDAEPAAAVQEALSRWEADALFMGAFGRGRIRDFLFGSHTAAILELADVPVFVAR